MIDLGADAEDHRRDFSKRHSPHFPAPSSRRESAEFFVLKHKAAWTHGPAG
jgi:hypothetical protein